MGKVVEIDCEKPMKLETSPKVTKSKRSLHWCRSISKKYLCTFYYSISQKVITLSGRRFITVSGILLHYRAFFITLSGSYYSIGRLNYYIIGWYRSHWLLDRFIFRHQSSRSFALVFTYANKLVAQLNGCASSTSQAYIYARLCWYAESGCRK